MSARTTLFISLIFIITNSVVVSGAMAAGGLLRGGVVAFFGVLPDASDNEILIADLQTAIVVNLTHHPGDDRFPSWSPDGRRLAFISDRSGTERVYTLHPGAAAPAQLLTPAEPFNTYDYLSYQYPHWSQDGERVLFTRAPSPGTYQIPLYSADLSSGVLSRINQTTDDGQDYIAQLMAAMDNTLYLNERSGQIVLNIMQPGLPPHRFIVADAQEYLNASFRRYPAFILLLTNTHEGSTLSVMGTDGRLQQRISLGDIIARDPVWQP